MEFQEPRIEFVDLSLEDIITASGEGGSSADVCQGNSDNSCPDSSSFI